MNIMAKEGIQPRFTWYNIAVSFQTSVPKSLYGSVTFEGHRSYSPCVLEVYPMAMTSALSPSLLVSRTSTLIWACQRIRQTQTSNTRTPSSAPSWDCSLPGPYLVRYSLDGSAMPMDARSCSSLRPSLTSLAVLCKQDPCTSACSSLLDSLLDLLLVGPEDFLPQSVQLH
jgi:hypothetical protein